MVYDASISKGDELSYSVGGDRHTWVQVIKGGVAINGTHLGAGDGAAISEESELLLRAEHDAEILLFDLA